MILYLLLASILRRCVRNLENVTFKVIVSNEGYIEKDLEEGSCGQ
jgi:hypothetical protein